VDAINADMDADEAAFTVSSVALAVAIAGG
jgi:hypothetical protein